MAAFVPVVGRPFSVLLVQPHLKPGEEGSCRPWLPQSGDSQAAEAIVHLVYDGQFAENRGVMQRQIRAAQYRAIETRKWDLVCSTWSGSAIIDPAGAVVAQLPATSGVLRTVSRR